MFGRWEEALVRGWRGRERGVEEGALRAASVPPGLRASEPTPRERLGVV